MIFRQLFSYNRPVLALLASASLLLPSVAAASPNGRSADPSSALSQYRAAYDAMKRGEWQKARALLLELWNESRTYDVAASLGQVEYQLLNFPAAAQYMAFAIEHVAPKEKFSNLQRYRAALDEIRAWVGTVRLTVSEPGAQIRMDGQVVGHGPFDSEVFVKPGTHTVEARFGADHVASKKISIAAGETITETLELPKTVEPSETRVPVVSSGATTALVPRDEGASEGDGRSMLPAYIGAGVTALGVATAVGFGIAANSAENEADTLRARLGPNGCADGSADATDCRAASDAVDRQQRAAAISTIGIGVGAAAGLATLAYIFVWPDAKEKRSGAVRPTVALSAQGGGVALSGAF